MNKFTIYKALKHSISTHFCLVSVIMDEGPPMFNPRKCMKGRIENVNINMREKLMFSVFIGTWSSTVSSLVSPTRLSRVHTSATDHRAEAS